MNTEINKFESLIGLPYIEESRNCWNFVQTAAKLVNIDLPDYQVPESYKELTNLINKEKQNYQKIQKPELYCLVLFRVPHITGFGWHCGLMISENQFIHCIKNTGVVITKLTNPIYRVLLEGFYKVSKEENDSNSI